MANLMFEPIKKYATFTGRARRKEYWLFQLFVILSILVLYAVVIGFIGIGGAEGGFLGFGLMGAYYLFLIIPSIAVGVRRMHDIGKSGAWILISFVPLIGGIWYLILTVTEGEPGSNQYGSDPKVEGGGNEVDENVLDA